MLQMTHEGLGGQTCKVTLVTLELHCHFMNTIDMPIDITSLFVNIITVWEDFRIGPGFKVILVDGNKVAIILRTLK